jgi:iron(II)-dependent oxidoreductase
VNRNEYDVEGDQTEVHAGVGVRYLDLYHGLELKPQRRPDGQTVLAFPIEAKGYGAIMAISAAPDQKTIDLMAKMKQRTTTPPAIRMSGRR